MRVWVRLAVLLGGVKAALGLVLYLSGVPLESASPAVPLFVYGALTAAFVVVGGLLVGGNRRDARAVWLGAMFMVIAATLAPGVNQAVPGALGLVSCVRPEAWLPALFWRFVLAFPSRLGGVAGSAAWWAGTASLALGTVALLANATLIGWPLAAGGGDPRAWLVVGSPASLYWPLLFGASVLALPLLLWRARIASADERPRVRLFVRGIALGLAPFALEVLAEALIPGYNAITSREPVRGLVGAVIFGALATVPFVTAYSVLFDRVVELRVVLRAALQHMLARYAIAGLAAIPFAALAVYLYVQRAEALATLFAGPRPLLLLAAVTLGLGALRLRQRWLDAVDRRYFREPYDPHQILARFVGELQAETPEQLAARVVQELDRALHVDSDVFLANDARTALRDVRNQRPGLAASATIVELALNDALPMDVDLHDPRSALQRLPEAEKRWLTGNDVHLLAALKSGDGKLGGVLALSGKRSGLAFSALDRQLIAAVAAAASLALENLRLRSTPPSPVELPAQECLECSRLMDSTAAQCSCGGTLVEAPVPQTLRGTFRLQQRLGAGGMGVVYRAIDLHLGRDVAIKTLPRVSAPQAARLRKEARAMAMVAHPNLATVFGIESWRDVPFLVEEYMAAGTLAHQLARRRLSLSETVELGVALADALDHLHGARLLHCDVKPSNIGFTSRGVAKLLDFGLARLLREALPPSEVPTVTSYGSESPPSPPLVAATASGGFAGTPHYMSPEAVSGAAPTPAFDVWGLSVVLFEALAGRKAFDGTTAPEIFARITGAARPDLRESWPDCPPPVAGLFERLLALDPEARPRDPAALRTALHALRPVAQLH